MFLLHHNEQWLFYWNKERNKERKIIWNSPLNNFSNNLTICIHCNFTISHVKYLKILSFWRSIWMHLCREILLQYGVWLAHGFNDQFWHTWEKPLNFVENENQVRKHLPGWMDAQADGWKKERKKESLGWILPMSFKIRRSYMFFFLRMLLKQSFGFHQRRHCCEDYWFKGSVLDVKMKQPLSVQH